MESFNTLNFQRKGANDMKKIIIISIIVLISLVMCLWNKTFALSEYTLGDVDNNTVVDKNDLKLITKHISESRNNSNNNEWILSGERSEAADINRDGKINIGDVMAMISYLTTKRNPYNIVKQSQMG